jgi:hypothetical protein
VRHDRTLIRPQHSGLRLAAALTVVGLALGYAVRSGRPLAGVLVLGALWVALDVVRGIRRDTLVLSRAGLAQGERSEPVPWNSLRLVGITGLGSRATLELLRDGGSLVLLALAYDLPRVERALRDHGIPLLDERARAEVQAERAARGQAWKARLAALGRPLRARDRYPLYAGGLALGLGAVAAVSSLGHLGSFDAAPQSSLLGVAFAVLLVPFGLLLLWRGTTTVEVTDWGVTVRTRRRAHGVPWGAVTGLEDLGAQWVIVAGSAWLVLPSFSMLSGEDVAALGETIHEACLSRGVHLQPGRYRLRQHPSTRLPS